MASAASVRRTRQRISSARSDVLGCPFKLGRDEASLFSPGAADKLGDDSTALLILTKSVQPILLLFLHASIRDQLPERSEWYCNCWVKITAITAARKSVFSWTVNVPTLDIAQQAAAVEEDIQAAEGSPNLKQRGCVEWKFGIEASFPAGELLASG